MENHHTLGARAPRGEISARADAGFPTPLAERIKLFGDDALLASAEWAAMRSVGERTVQRERKLGTGAPYIRITAKKVAYRFADCLEFLRRRRVGAVEDAAA